MSGRSQAMPVSSPQTGTSPNQSDCQFTAPSSTVGSPTTNAATLPASPARRPGVMTALSRTFFGTSASKEKSEPKVVDLVTQEGSIKMEAWTLMRRGNTNKTRMRTLINLQESSPQSSPLLSHRRTNRIARLFDGVMKNRNLQVSTLEGIWHETQDMLGEEETREPTLKAIIELTQTQHSQLGLALRHTFFEKIRDLGCEEKTLKWLSALSNDGKDVTGFEKAMDFLVADWLKQLLSEDDNPHAIQVLQLAQQFIVHNSAFICETSMITMVHYSCMRCARPNDPLTAHCLELIEYILKYSDLPRSELDYVVTTLCSLVCNRTFIEQAWNVARSLLNSQMGHRTRKILINMLDTGQSCIQRIDADRPSVLRSLRGAVYFLCQATWGAYKIESVRTSPAFVIPAFEHAVGADPILCSDILLGLKRLVVKFGRDLQHITWRRIIRLFHVVHEFLLLDPTYGDCRKLLSSLLDQLEVLQRDGYYSGNSEELYELIESCLDCRSDDSILALIKHRENEISQLTPDWVVRARSLVERYAATNFSVAVRREAVASLQAFYTQYKSVSEHEIVTTLLLPTLEQLIPIEEQCEVQYQMLITLFDITRSLPLRSGESSALFDTVLNIISRMFLDGLHNCFDVSQNQQPNKSWGGFCIENMEVVVKEFDVVLSERWATLPYSPFATIFNMLMENVRKQYSLGQFAETGGEVRAAVFSILFSVRSCPITRRLIRNRDDSPDPHINLFIRLFDGQDGEFTWMDLAEITITALEKDRYWSVLSSIFTGLGRILEYTQMVKSAGAANIDRLIDALLGVNDKALKNEYVYRETENEKIIESCQGEAKNERLKHVPIILATLVGYSMEENKSDDLCAQIVEYVRQGSIEAIIAASVALQRVPQSMSSVAPKLIKSIVLQPSTPKRAIPTVEFFADAVLVPLFYRNFSLAQYKEVVNCLAPYSMIRHYNPFIVAFVHRTLMAWIAKVPERLRYEFGKYVVERVHDAPISYYTEGMSRQPSGDGRQEVGSIYQLGAGPETPPLMGGISGQAKTAKNTCDQISEEIELALESFCCQGRIDDPVEDNTLDKLKETSLDHYLFGDTIATFRVLVDKNEDDEVTGAIVESKPPSPKNNAKSGASEQRRRFQSAVHPSRKKAEEENRRTMDDMEVERRERSLSTPWNGTTLATMPPAIGHIQVIFRNLYGRRSFLLKSTQVPSLDFESLHPYAIDAGTILQGVHSMPNVIPFDKKDADQMSIRLRNLDRMPGVELHAVGVLYKAPGQTTDAEMLKNVYGSERYTNFLRLLGESCSLTRQPGGLIKGKHGTYTYHHRDEINRIVFLIASLMPTVESDPACNAKKQLIGNNFVTVVFNESGTPYRMGSTNFTHVAIEITPVDATSMLIFVHSRKEIACWLGLQKVLLADALAARIVRQMVIRTNLAVNVWRSLQETPDHPFLSLAIARLRSIRSIGEKCRSIQSNNSSPNVATLNNAQ